MSDHARKLAAVGFLLFLCLWVAGFIQSLSLEEPELLISSSPVLISASGSLDNYRSGMGVANNLAQIGLAQTPLPQVLEQADIHQIRIYEKTAQIAAGSPAFAADEQHIRGVLATHKAITFSEKATGIAPRRELVLGISVHPDQFDSLLEELTGIGQIESITVEKLDRTEQFRRLHGQRQSLKKHQEAILKLRGAENMSVEETLKLEQKILELEKEQQTLGVQLGDLLGKEPAYNLFLTLQEYHPGSRHDPSFTLARRVGSGLVWAVGWWIVTAVGIGLLIATYLSIRTLWPGRRPSSAPRTGGPSGSG